MAPQLFYLQYNSRFLSSQKSLQQMNHHNVVSKVTFCFIFKKGRGMALLYFMSQQRLRLLKNMSPFPTHQKHKLIVPDDSVDQPGFERLYTYLSKHMTFFGPHLLQLFFPYLDYQQPSFFIYFCLFRNFFAQFLHPNLLVIS